MAAEPTEALNPEYDPESVPTAVSERGGHLTVVDPDTVIDRVVVDDTADTDPDVADESPAGTADTVETTSGWKQVVGAVRFDAPLFTERPYSAAEVWQRAKHGAQVAPNGPLRVVAYVHGAISVPLVYACNATQWLLATPTRMTLMAVLCVAAAFSPVAATAVDIAFLPITALTALTH